MISSGVALSVVVPAYNEEACIHGTITALARELDSQGIAYELIVVDNGSTDSTGAILEERRAQLPALRVLRFEKNEGYGKAILTGMKSAGGEVVGFTCADGEVSPGDLAMLFKVLRAGELDLCKGKRIGRRDGALRQMMSIGYQLVVGFLFRVHSTDINGYPLLMRRQAHDVINASRPDWIINLELLLGARRHGLKIAEVDVRHLPRAGGRSHVRWYYPLLFLWQLAGYWSRRRDG